MRTLLAASALATAASPVLAQDGSWSYGATLYLWATDTVSTLDTSLGELESELTFSDALSQLDFAFMGAFEASNAPWSVVADFFYFNLSESNSINLSRYSKLSTRTELAAFSAYGFYRLTNSPVFYFDVGAGFRVYSLDQEVRVTGTGPKRKFEASETWTDPLIAARLRYDFDDRWFGTLAADYGGFDGEDNQTWSALATVGYEINDRWSVRAGWRTLEIGKEVNGRDFTNTQSGPIFGATYRF